MNSAPNMPLSVFSCLSLGGTSGYSIEGDRVLIEIDKITNLKEFGFLSGTLSVELWAMPQAYDGEELTGYQLAFTTIGELSSQHYLSNCRYDLNYQQPPDGEWFFTLMLREWDGNEYVTGDYVNFELPVLQGSLPEETQPEVKTTNVIHLAYNSANEAHAKAEQQVLHTPGFEKKVRIQKPKQTPQKTKMSKKEANLLRRLNSSSVDDFVSIKGIFKRLAEELKVGQPYKETTDLLKIKGIGKKKLEAVRSAFSGNLSRTLKSKKTAK